MARHVAGGELFYEYISPGNTPGTSVYRITLRLFRDCASPGPLLQNESVTVGIYANNLLVSSLPLPISTQVRSISLNTAVFPCLVGSVSVCYEMAMYSAVITLTDNILGYTLSRIGCCRVDRISNLSQPLSVGSNYVTKIPGKNTLPSGINNSPQFYVKDTALVCASKTFTLDFGASDADGDVLTYSFCEAFTANSGSNNLPPGASLNLIPLPYASPFNGNFPLGDKVTINPKTGIISGIAPPEGSYVVNVCITEWRNGKAFNEHRKDFILKVQNCDFVEAVLPEKIIQCKDFKVLFENQSTSSAITSYTWNFGDPVSNANISTNATPEHIYSDTGRFVARLSVTGPKGCVGEDSTLVLVYPGFNPAYSILGGCYQNPFQFNDATTTKYGFVDSWRWNFGVDTTEADTAIVKNPKYLYATPSTKKIELVVTNSKGCIDSLSKNLIVSDKPMLQLPFKDTLICSIDTLSIPINNPGNFSWLPNKNIIGANTANPKVFPKDTTRYIVTVRDNACISIDTLTVNVLNFIKVNAGKDTIVCTADTIRLHPISQALSYQWKASTGESLANEKNTLVKPLVNTLYYVIANLGKCQDRDTINIKVVPYPFSQLGPDTTICFGSRILIRSRIIGSNYAWTPTNSLLNANTTTPISGPSKTTSYVLTVGDTLGCPKKVSDTMFVIIAPTIIAFAGRDTSVIINQPLQLMATGGEQYKWTPEFGLSNPNIANPIAIYDERTDSIRYTVRVTGSGGCFAEDDVLIKVFKSGPDIFVPTAFTPNADGKNDILRPITIGISKLNYFRVYNRFGQLLFSTGEFGKGWDGYFKNVQQPSGTYVFVAEGADYLGKLVFRKGTAVLIR